jgi:hypothetical protein
MICPECGTRLPVGCTKCHFCGNEISLSIETSLVDKFIALFTLWAFFVAVTIMFYTMLEGVGDSNTLRGIVSMVGAIFITFFYWLISSWAIKRLIDPILNKKI